MLRLQAELETSEQVQRDFVRLSQALQVWRAPPTRLPWLSVTCPGSCEDRPSTGGILLLLLGLARFVPLNDAPKAKALCVYLGWSQDAFSTGLVTPRVCAISTTSELELPQAVLGRILSLFPDGIVGLGRPGAPRYTGPGPCHQGRAGRVGTVFPYQGTSSSLA